MFVLNCYGDVFFFVIYVLCEMMRDMIFIFFYNLYLLGEDLNG